MKEVPTVKEIRTAMGYVETVGLTAAIAAADAALKAANVDLVGREISKGGGMVTVKLSGNVGAVRAGVAAARAEGERVGEVVSARVIARPAATHGPVMGYNGDTMGVVSWLEGQGVDEEPVSVYRPQGRRPGPDAVFRSGKELQAKPSPAPEVSPEEESLPSAEPRARADEAIQESPPEEERAQTGVDPSVGVEDGYQPSSQSPETARASSPIEGQTSTEDLEGSGETEPGTSGTKRQRRRPSGKKTPSAEQVEGEPRKTVPRRRTRRKKKTDTDNNETSGRS